MVKSFITLTMNVKEGYAVSNLSIPADQWLKEQFILHYCDECGGDTQHHTAVPVMGNWFARCDYPPDENGNRDPVIETFRKEPL
jgi:hypothetical protein